MSFAKTEPAALAEFVRLVLAGLVTLGWVALDNELINAIGTIVAALGSVALTVFTRSRVSPVGSSGPDQHLTY